ncbi:MAG: D-2-hydroxyacid dehydrogenase [Anderseniella sp.]|nr:D-2-hydroxyacid dehydrogenase [Anderseniella sp.]
MTKIVFLDRGTFAPEVELTRPEVEHEWVDYDNTPADKIVERLQGATIAITNKVPIRRETLEQLPGLKMVSVAATGFDVIDVPACRDHGVAVSNVRGYATHTVPEHTFGLIFALRRGIAGYKQDVANGKWQESGQFCFHTHPIKDLAGSVLGIFGEGNLGQGVADIAKAFGMKPVFAAHKGVDGLGPLYTPFDEVLETADIITLHCPLMDATRNMIAMPEFRKMKKKPFIINTARGGLVNEADMVQALDEGLISGIGFDVLTKEPPAPDQPLLKVMDRPNVIITPHVAWASLEAQTECWRQTVDHVNAFFAGQPRNLVT